MVENYPLPSPASLALAKAGAQRPAYDRGRLRAGIVHLGLGAFVRAHQALYTEELHAAR
jgi:fructuronate reductase